MQWKDVCTCDFMGKTVFIVRSECWTLCFRRLICSIKLELCSYKLFKNVLFRVRILILRDMKYPMQKRRSSSKYFVRHYRVRCHSFSASRALPVVPNNFFRMALLEIVLVEPREHLLSMSSYLSRSYDQRVETIRLNSGLDAGREQVSKQFQLSEFKISKYVYASPLAFFCFQFKYDEYG